MKKLLLFLLLMCGSLHGLSVFKPAEMLFFKGVDDDGRHLIRAIKTHQDKAKSKDLDTLDLSYTKVTREQFERICKLFGTIKKINLRGCNNLDFGLYDKTKEAIPKITSKTDWHHVVQSDFPETLAKKKVESLDISEIGTRSDTGHKYFAKGHRAYMPSKEHGVSELICEGGAKVIDFAEKIRTRYGKASFSALDISRHAEFFEEKYEKIFILSRLRNVKKFVAKNMTIPDKAQYLPKDITYFDFSGSINLGAYEPVVTRMWESTIGEDKETFFTHFGRSPEGSSFKWWSKVTHLILDDSDIDDKALECILFLQTLKALRIHNTNVTIKFLEKLSKLDLIANNITELSYSHKDVDLSEEDVQKLYGIFSRFKNLRILEAPQLDSAKNLEALKDLKLEKFVAHKVAVGEGTAGYDFSGLEHIKQVTSLAFLGELKREQGWGEWARGYFRKSKKDGKLGSLKDLTKLQELKVKDVKLFGDELINTLPKSLIKHLHKLSLVNCGNVTFENLYRFAFLTDLTLHTPFTSERITLGKFQSLQHIDLKREKGDISFQDTGKQGMIRSMSVIPHEKKNRDWLVGYFKDKLFPWETIVSDGKTNWHCGWGKVVEKELKFDR